MSQTQKVTAYFIKHPTANVAEVARKYNVSIPLVYVARKNAMRQAQEQIATEALGPQVDEPKARTRQVGGDHYKNMGVEPWDVVDTWPREQRIGYYRGGALKYIMRMGSKDMEATEVAKGQHYIQKLLEVLGEQA
jgi:transposase-like protein